MEFLLGLMMLAASLPLGRPSPEPSVVAEARTSAEHPVAAIEATLDWRRQYTIRIDGPEGASFSAVSAETYVDAGATPEGSGDRGQQFDGTAPYAMELVPPAPDLRYWHYALVVIPGGEGNLTVSILTGDGD